MKKIIMPGFLLIIALAALSVFADTTTAPTATPKPKQQLNQQLKKERDELKAKQAAALRICAADKRIVRQDYLNALENARKTYQAALEAAKQTYNLAKKTAELTHQDALNAAQAKCKVTPLPSPTP